MNIVLIAPSNVSGGVTTVLRKLHKGLINEGFHVDLVRLGDEGFPLLSAMRDDILNVRYLANYDVALYLGSVPWPSHTLAKLLEVPVALFLHGFTRHELFHEILHGTELRSKAGNIVITVMLQTAISLGTVDLYICHSLTACEANGISSSFVLLPQWIFPEELRNLDLEPQAPGNNMVRIVAYTSYARSPRLLNPIHLISLVQIVKRRVDREFELILVDPRGRAPSLGPVKVVRPVPHEKFLSLLASADLYIELCTDEELRLASLEAMAVGTPVAKLTHPGYWDRQDYGEEDLILARSFKELAGKLVEYINNVNHYYHYYSKRGRGFVLTKRVWNTVKEPLLTALRSIS